MHERYRSLLPLSFHLDRFLFPFGDERFWAKRAGGLDVLEKDKEIVVKAAVPGIPADKVNVTFKEGTLRIKAETEEKKEEKEKGVVVHRLETRSAFDYETTLPKSIKEDEIKTEVADGLVTVTAPISEK